VDIIQEVGAYAGFAAVVGLAVLSALYFSQARDLRRLREWAGRAPERAADQVLPGQTVLPEQAAQEAVRPAPSGAVRPIPAVKGPATPPGAKPATPGAKPAPATPGAKPVPATAAAKPGEPPAKPAPGTPAKPGQVAPVPATAAATPAAKAAPGAPAAPGPAVAAKPVTPPPAPARPPAVPSRPPPVARAPVSAASQSTAVLPASARLRESGRSGASRRDGLDARHIALIVAGVIVIGAAAAFGISQLGGDDKPSTNDSQPGDADRQAPINPTTVTVSVLNGTTVPGLAAQIGDEVEAAGFQRGNVANAIDQQRSSSVVLFAEGADREARLVARKLGIARVEPIDPDSQALAGNASVVVIVGADQTQ
jgi:hypothetical protein